MAPSTDAGSVVQSLAEGRQDRRFRVPHAAAHEDAARLEVEVAAHAHAGAARRRRALPGELGALRGLVGRLVLREADVAVDAERRACGVGTKRQSTGGEAVRQGDAERLEGLLDESLVVGLARLEPGPIVVLREVGQELQGVGLKPSNGPGMVGVPVIVASADSASALSTFHSRLL